AGTLQLGDGGTSGSIVGDVANSGALVLFRSDTLTFDGAISGSGVVEQRGTGTTVLTGTSTYTGGTTISAGTLQLGDGGATGSIVGDVANNGALAFNRSDTVVFNGVISGAGAVEQRGAGVTILTGANTYTGATTIEQGTLALAGGGSIAQSRGVRADGVLDISGTTGGASVRSLSGAGRVDLGAQTLTLTAAADRFAGVIQGTGGLALAGGTEVLSGNNTYTGPTAIAAGATLQLGVGGTSGSIVGTVVTDGALVFNRSDTLTFAGVISGGGAINQIGSGTTILTGDSSAFAGRTTVSSGILSVNGMLGGTMDVVVGRLQGIGTVGTTTNLAGGAIAPGNSIGTLTIAGNYLGSGGVLEIEAQLGGDGPPSDRLVVTGSTAGTTTVRVINVGGAGAQTVEGIKVIDVAGASDGTFTLQGDYVLNGAPVVVAGAYGYALQKNGLGTPDEGDWYLRSALLNPVRPADPPTPLYQAGVPVYEAYGQALLGLNGLGTLEQRVGNRTWMPGSDGARAGAGIWGRIDAGYSSIDPDVSTSGTRFNATTWRLQAGFDAVLHDGTSGSLIGGFTVHYATSATDVGSTNGKGRISTDAYGVAGTLTWHGAGGLYLDGQTQLTWYDSDLTSRTASRNLAKGNGAFGYAVGLEGGHRLALAPSWSLTPQAQLVYSRVSAERFTDPYGARVSLDDADSLHGRVGVALDYQSAWSDPAGQAGRAKLYGIANLHYEFLDGTAADVAGTRFVSRQQRLWGSLGAGGTLDWANGKYALYGEASIATSLADFGDNYTVKGTAGFRFRW
ncbi:autotransporter outer membrane beta-barrel domain-containing protein, partial [Vineibacter terrae]|uniref:autotransporter family protein n=1 Tax=Vineibacter terrae TaxID=2586908 RepID=UPI002E3154E9